jgi:hypothetical protein
VAGHDATGSLCGASRTAIMRQIFAGHELAHGAQLFGLQLGIRANLGKDGAIPPVLVYGLSHARGISVQRRRMVSVGHLGFSRSQRPRKA